MFIKFAFILLLASVVVRLEAQPYQHPTPNRNKCAPLNNEVEKRNRTIDTLFRLTGLKIKEHPLVWLEQKMKTSTYRIDTNTNEADSSVAYTYYDEKGKPFKQQINSYKKSYEYQIITIYDENGNDIFSEGISCKQPDIRVRTIYDLLRRPVIRCTYFSEPKIERVDINMNNKEYSIYTRCKCDF